MIHNVTMMTRSDNMDINDIKQRARELKGVTSYRIEIHAIKDDLSLLNPFAKRIKTCSFPLEVRIANRAFDMIFTDWCYDINYVEDVYAVYTMLTEIVTDIYNESGKYTDKEKHDFLEWCYNYNIDVDKFIRYTIDCSRGIAGTLCEVQEIMREIERERGE